MTSIRFHWRPSRKEGPPAGVLYIRVIHNRRYKDIVRDYMITAEEWDGESRTVRIAADAGREQAGSGRGLTPQCSQPALTGGRHTKLKAIAASMQEDIERLESIVKGLSEKGNFTVYDVCRLFRQNEVSHMLDGYCALLARELEGNGQVRTARAYLSASRSLTSFARRSVILSDIDGQFIRSYERYLLDRGLKMNTVSFYMRNIRAVYNRAIKAGIITGHNSNPFEDVFTGVFETKRRALDQQELGRLASLDLSESHGLKDALNYFMFAFHARGMSFVDLAYLKKSEINGDTILYKRKKTGFFIEVKVTRPMRRIIASFKKQVKSSPYVFPIIFPSSGSDRQQYETGLTRQNKLLKDLAEMAGIGKNLSTHVARHTWATIAKRMGYGIPLISEALGHRDIKVTSTYLASFERSAMDELSTRLSKSVRAA